ncbi:MAG: hypothetical protein RR645_06435, partial [Clostridium sp.]
ARFLGKNFEKIEKKFNGLWQKENKKNLKVILDSILKEKKIYDKLCKEFTMFSLGECDFKLYMDLREKFAGANIAIVEGKKICLAYPNNAEIRCMVGKMLINGDNIQGIEYIEAAVKINPFVSLEGYRDIINYYTRKESYDKAEAYQKSYEILEKKCRLAIHERQKPSLSNKSYDKLNLDKDTLLDIRKTLSTKKYIKNAYISKLNVTRFQEISHYILWVNFRLNFFTMEETLNNIDREIQSDVGMNNITVIHLNGDNFYMRYPLKNIKKCKIYSSR